MKLIVVVTLLCSTISVVQPYGDVGSDVEFGLGLPFLGKIKLGLGGGLGFDEGLFGLGKKMIVKALGKRILSGRRGAGGKADKGLTTSSQTLFKQSDQSSGRVSGVGNGYKAIGELGGQKFNMKEGGAENDGDGNRVVRSAHHNQP